MGQHDQPTHSNRKSERKRTTTKFIKQDGSHVHVGQFGFNQIKIVHSVACKSRTIARRLALGLAGLKIIEDNSKRRTYAKLKTHPWYGTVILGELSNENCQFIVIYVAENAFTPSDEFKYRVCELFIDNSRRPPDRALIPEILLVVECSENKNE